MASISHISRVSVTTKIPHSQVGYRASYLDGHLVGEPTPVAANQGTTITIQDLFYNNPVRGTITLATKSEEYAKILALTQRYAISRAEQCAFSCRRVNGSTDLVTRVGSTSIDVIRSIFGDTVDPSALLNLVIPELATGLVSNAYHRQRNFVFILFINGRFVDCPRLKRTVSAFYSEILFTNTHPFVYLSLTLPSENVDVNVHPTKKQVIFLHEEEIISQVVAGIRDLVTSQGVIPARRGHISNSPKVSEDVLRQIIQVKKTSSKHSTRPFDLVHADPKRRTLDSFVFNKTNKESSEGSISSAVRRAADAKFSAMIEIPATVSDNNSEHSIATQEESINTFPSGNPFVAPSTDVGLLISPIDDALLLQPRREADREASAEVTEIIKKHTLVGILDDRRTFVQFDTALLLADLPRIFVEWAYLKLLFDNEDACKYCHEVSIKESIKAYFDKEDVVSNFSQDEIVYRISQILKNNSNSICSVGIRPFVDCLLIPRLLECIHLTDEHIGSFLVQMASDTDREFLITHVCRLLVEIYSSAIDFTDQLFLESVLLPALRNPPSTCCGYPSVLLKNGALLKLATTHELYKIFERC